MHVSVAAGATARQSEATGRAVVTVPDGPGRWAAAAVKIPTSISRRCAPSRPTAPPGTLQMSYLGEMAESDRGVWFPVLACSHMCQEDDKNATSNFHRNPTSWASLFGYSRHLSGLSDGPTGCT